MKLGTKNIKILAYNEEVYIDFLNGTIKSFNIPDGLTEIKSYLFYNCTALTSIAIPDSVTYIDYYAFEGCTNLTSITVEGKSEGEIKGAPWGATNATVTWTGVGKI